MSAPLPPMPILATFQSSEAPPSYRWLGMFFRRGEAGPGAPLPITFNAPTRTCVIAKAEAWWAEEVAREARKRADAEERAARLRRVNPRSRADV